MVGIFFIAAGAFVLAGASPAANASKPADSGLTVTMDGGPFDVVLSPGQPASHLLHMRNGSSETIDVDVSIVLNELASHAPQMDRILVSAASVDSCAEAPTPSQFLALGDIHHLHTTELRAGKSMHLCVNVMLADDGTQTDTRTVVDVRFDAMTQPARVLAHTGSDGQNLELYGIAALVAGLILVLTGRRRRKHPTTTAAATARTDSHT